MARKATDLSGNKFGNLLVIERADDRVSKSGRKSVAYLCKCDCGNHTVVSASELRRGKVVACGCLRGRSTKHGGSYSRAYRIWRSMRARCGNPNAANFIRYGARGIKVCERWDDFALFIADMGEPPEGYSLDRIDGNANYEPSNCRWASAKDQADNRKSSVWLSYDGKEMNLSDWARHLGVNKQTLSARLKKGWPIDRILTDKIR